MADEIKKTDDEWKKELTPEQFAVCRLHATEAPFSGIYADTKDPGIYVCSCCGQRLFDSKAKFDSGSGWPSYWQPVSKDAVVETKDTSHGMVRIEVSCSKCRSHLGHVFPDGPKPTGLRYCINSVSLDLKKE